MAVRKRVAAGYLKTNIGIKKETTRMSGLGSRWLAVFAMCLLAHPAAARTIDIEVAGAVGDSKALLPLQVHTGF